VAREAAPRREDALCRPYLHPMPLPHREPLDDRPPLLRDLDFGKVDRERIALAGRLFAAQIGESTRGHLEPVRRIPRPLSFRGAEPCRTAHVGFHRRLAVAEELSQLPGNRGDLTVGLPVP